MDDQNLNQYGSHSICVGHNNGTICIRENYGHAERADAAFADQSFELQSYTPKINPPIKRDEVGQILEWIEREASKEKPNRVALLYGSPGIGKSVVMHDVLTEIAKRDDYLSLGLKSDQIEFSDTDDLGRRMRLAQPILSVIRDMAQKKRRVVVLIDQIDALSLSLSSNRTPLRSVFKLMEQLKSVPHVRVVVSCRPYDLEYDPILNDLKVGRKWELKKLSANNVMKVLEENGMQSGVGEHLIDFLGNPLYLYLYMKVMPYGELRNPITEDVLYDELWRKFVRDVPETQVNREKHLVLLDRLTDHMYRRQELHVSIKNYESSFVNELRYLLSNGLLVLTSNGRLQFFHQTLFDYVYARRFVENGHDLLVELSTQHQGLFIRAAVRSILGFLRETDPVLYKQNICSILFDKNTDGTDKYRFHLKSLALSNMTYFDVPKAEEKSLIERNVFEEEMYMSVILESVHNGEWLDAIWDIVERKGGWCALKRVYKEKVIAACGRVLWADADKLIGMALKILSYGIFEDKELVMGMVDYRYLDGSSECLMKLYKALDLKAFPLECKNLLISIAKETPDFVCDVLKMNIAGQLAQNEKSDFQTIRMNHGEEEVLEALEKNHPDCSIRLYMEMLSMIFESTKYSLPNTEISSSFEFSHFQRTPGGHFYRDFTVDVVNKLIDAFLKDAEKDTTKEYLQKFSGSEYEAFVFMAFYIYAEKAVLFHNETFLVLTNRSVLCNAPCWVEYQALEALKTSFPYMDDCQKEEIIHLAETMTDEGECHVYDKEMARVRNKYGQPLFDMDLHRGRVLHALPKDDLRKFSWTAYQECLRVERKYVSKDKKGVDYYPRLENEMPFRSTSMVGWSALSAEKSEKMSCKAWLKSMIKYTDDGRTPEMEHPSLTGQCHRFRKVVSEHPEHYLNLLDQIVSKENMPLAYAETGLNGLLDAGRYEEAEHLFVGIVNVIKGDVNACVRGFDLHTFLYSIDKFIHCNQLPEPVYSFLREAVLNASENEVDADDMAECDICNKAINQSRGHAAYMLVKCSRWDKYGNSILETLEHIATSASVYTRSAVLLNMALLNHIDKQRNVSLFKCLLHDHDARLMAMPVHNYNPLVYFVKYAVDDLLDFFRHAVAVPACHKEQVILLWLAWSHNNHRHDIRDLLDAVCEESEDARVSLLGFLARLDKNISDDAVNDIICLMNERFVSENLGRQCDTIFHNVKDWPERYQYEVAKAYVASPMSAYSNRGFVGFLASYAIKNPIQALAWLECLLSRGIPKDYSMWNVVTDVLIQSYNGIKSFNDNENQKILESAMDWMDSLLVNKDSKYLITNFIRKLDEK